MLNESLYIDISLSLLLNFFCGMILIVNAAPFKYINSFEIGQNFFKEFVSTTL